MSEPIALRRRRRVAGAGRIELSLYLRTPQYACIDAVLNFGGYESTVHMRQLSTI